MIRLEINGKNYDVDVQPDVPLLWVIRERLKLTGTKFGCGIGMCGSCTVHLDGKAVRSCQTPAGSAQGKKIMTIEGLPENHPVKQAWVKEQVPQCGYCQSGQIMQAAALLHEDPHPADAADRRAHERQPLPLRHLSQDQERHPARVERREEMKTDLTRRDFLKMTGTGLAIAVVSTAAGYRLLSAAEMEKRPRRSSRAPGFASCPTIPSSLP